MINIIEYLLDTNESVAISIEASDKKRYDAYLKVMTKYLLKLDSSSEYSVLEAYGNDTDHTIEFAIETI